MTATLTAFILQTIEDGTASIPSTTLGIVLAALLIVVLILKEFVRASDAPQRRRRAQVFNIVIVPLLLAFALIAIIRIMDLLNL
jgi:hypothetical protein